MSPQNPSLSPWPVLRAGVRRPAPVLRRRRRAGVRCRLCHAARHGAARVPAARRAALRGEERQDLAPELEQCPKGPVGNGEKQIRGSGGSLEPPGPLPMHLHTVYMEYSGCLPTLLNPLAERTCFSQVGKLSEIFRTMGWDIRANASVKVRKTPRLPRSWANFRPL